MLGQVAGFVVGFLQNNHGAYFDIDGWPLPVAKGSAKAIQVFHTYQNFAAVKFVGL